MPEFRVQLDAEAERNVDAIYDWLAQRSPDGALRWYRALHEKLSGLSRDPLRHPVAPESHHFGYTIRNATFRMRSRRVYRILFTVQGEDIHVHYVRGPGQDWPRG